MPRRRRQIAHHRALELAGALDLDLHHRLQQHRLRLGERLAHRRLGADLERHVGAVDLVVRAVFEIDRQADDRIPGDRALGQHRAEALLDGRDELLGNPPADDVLLEQEGLFGVVGQHVEPADDVGVLARAAGLLAVPGVELGGLRGRLAVVHLRRADLDRDVVLAANPLDVDLQVQLAHAGDDRLARLLVGR